MDFRKAVVERHSVRSYKDVDLDADARMLLEGEISAVNSDSGLNIQLIDGTDGVMSSMSRLFGWKSNPHNYIAMVGKDDDNLAVDCGYYGERLVLFAQSIGLNTCWIGMFRRSKVTADVKPGEKVCVIIFMGYGNDQGAPHKSKGIDDVSDVSDPPEWFVSGVECALLAPTAMNQQKFMFSLKDGEACISTKKGSFATVDMGIAKYHFEIASGHKVL